VIKSFRCTETRRFFETGRSKRFSPIANVAARKLAMLDADQFRICFRWADDGPTDVEIVDYH
jgi:proteic killer suppression protein